MKKTKSDRFSIATVKEHFNPVSITISETGIYSLNQLVESDPKFQKEPRQKKFC